MKKKTTELILPGGDLERVKTAFEYGADAVYIGLDRYSLRKSEVRFSEQEIKEAIDYAHKLGKRIFVTFNIFAHNFQLENIEKDLKLIAGFCPDAFIISDPGILALAKKVAPRVPIHLSTQANTINKEAVRFWKDYGVKRVVLGRETNLTEIEEIAKAVPDIEIEVFVHGAMCISYSGRCLLSSALTGRSANQGACAQPCRWNYKTYIEEEGRPGELMPIEEDEKGTYIMSSKDLKLIEHLEELINAGVKGFKIEGRNKTAYYVATTARAYSQAIKTVTDTKLPKVKKEKMLKELSSELDALTRRGYTTGFLLGAAKKGETYPARSPIEGQRFLGQVEEIKDNYAKVVVKNKIEAGKKHEVLTPNEIQLVKITEILDKNMEPINVISPGRTGEYV